VADREKSNMQKITDYVRSATKRQLERDASGLIVYRTYVENMGVRDRIRFLFTGNVFPKAKKK